MILCGKCCVIMHLTRQNQSNQINLLLNNVNAVDILFMFSEAFHTVKNGLSLDVSLL